MKWNNENSSEGRKRGFPLTSETWTPEEKRILVETHGISDFLALRCRVWKHRRNRERLEQEVSVRKKTKTGIEPDWKQGSIPQKIEHSPCE